MMLAMLWKFYVDNLRNSFYDLKNCGKFFRFSGKNFIDWNFQLITESNNAINDSQVLEKKYCKRKDKI